MKLTVLCFAPAKGKSIMEFALHTTDVEQASQWLARQATGAFFVVKPRGAKVPSIHSLLEAANTKQVTDT